MSTLDECALISPALGGLTTACAVSAATLAQFTVLSTSHGCQERGDVVTQNRSGDSRLSSAILLCWLRLAWRLEISGQLHHGLAEIIVVLANGTAAVSGSSAHGEDDLCARGYVGLKRELEL